MAAKLARAAGRLDAKDFTATVAYARGSPIAFATPTADRVAVKSTGTNISTNRQYATHVVAMVNLSADPVVLAQLR